MFERLLEATGVVWLLLLFGGAYIANYANTGCFTDSWPPDRSAATYTATVSRNYTNDDEQRMLGLAEAAYPPRDDVAAMAALDPLGIDNSEIPATGAWWYAEQNDIRLAYAITADAVNYYENLIAQWKADPPNAPWDTATLTYTAGAKFHGHIESEGAALDNVYVVNMSLTWFTELYNPGFLVRFSLNRTVILDTSGQVLYLFGDGGNGQGTNPDPGSIDMVKAARAPIPDSEDGNP